MCWAPTVGARVRAHVRSRPTENTRSWAPKKAPRRGSFSIAHDAVVVSKAALLAMFDAAELEAAQCAALDVAFVRWANSCSAGFGPPER
jgi:hypothetical protein